MPTTLLGVLRQVGRLASDFPTESEALTRRAFWRIAARFTPTLAVDRDGMRLMVSTDDQFVGRRLFVNNNVPEQDIERAFAGLRSIPGVAAALDGCLVVEVGSNIGSHTVEMLKRYGVGTVVAVEPHPENCRLLRQNVVVNGLSDRVTVLQLALSDRAGSVELELSASNSGDHRVRVGDAPLTGSEATRSTIDARCDTFDSLVESGEIEIASTGLIWMDAQGHEAHVLRGAAKHLLGSDIPIMMEYWPYGLRRAGGLDDLHALIAEHYSHVIDLWPADGTGPRVVSVHQISRLEAENGWAGTDDETAAGTDLILTRAIDAGWRMTDESCRSASRGAAHRL